MPHNLFSLHWPFEGSFAVAISMLVYCQTRGKIDRIYKVSSHVKKWQLILKVFRLVVILICILLYLSNTGYRHVSVFAGIPVYLS